MKRIAALVFLLSLPEASVALGQQTGERSTASGVFTTEQAKNGERQYQSNCASCHGADLRSTYSLAPDLVGAAFKFAWRGQTVADRFETIRSIMPLEQPGSLDDQTYLDIIAYILQFNGIPAGNQKLVPDGRALQQIVIAVP